MQAPQVFYNHIATQIILDFLKDGRSHTDILLHLVSNNVPSFTSLPWTSTSVANAIRCATDPNFRNTSIAAKNFQAAMNTKPIM
jgi:hypothetical protein